MGEKLTRMLLPLAVALAACAGTPERRLPPTLSGNAALSIEHRDEMSESFQLVYLRVTVGGLDVYERGSPEGTEPLPDRSCVYRAQVPRGETEVGVELGYRGHGAGVFSYLSGYTFAVRSTSRVEVPADAQTVHVVIAGVEEGGATAPLEERPKARFTVGVNEDDGCPP